MQLGYIHREGTDSVASGYTYISLLWSSRQYLFPSYSKYA